MSWSDRSRSRTAAALSTAGRQCGERRRRRGEADSAAAGAPQAGKQRGEAERRREAGRA